MNIKLNRICALALCSVLLNNFPLNVNASESLKDEKAKYVEYETDLINEENLPEYDSIESAINDK